MKKSTSYIIIAVIGLLVVYYYSNKSPTTSTSTTGATVDIPIPDSKPYTYSGQGTWIGWERDK